MNGSSDCKPTDSINSDDSRSYDYIENQNNQITTSINSPKEQDNASKKQEISNFIFSFLTKCKEENSKDLKQILTEINIGLNSFLDKVILEEQNLHVKIQELTNDINSYKAMIEAKDTKLKELQNTINLEKEKYDQLIKDYNKYKQANEEQKRELLRLKSENQYQTNTIQKLNDVISSNILKIKDQNIEIKSLTNECNSLKETLKKDTQQNDENSNQNQDQTLTIKGQYTVKIMKEEGLVIKKSYWLNKEQMDGYFLLNQKVFNLVGKLVNEPIKMEENIYYYKFFDGFDLLPSINNQVHRAIKSIKGKIKDKKEVMINILNGFMRLINEANIIVTDISNGNNIMVSNNSNDICFIDLDSSIDINSFEENLENSKMLLITMNNLWSIIVSLFTSTQITNKCRKKYDLRGSSGMWLIYFIQENKSIFNEFFEKLIDLHQSRNLNINDIKIFIDELKESVLNRWK